MSQPLDVLVAASRSLARAEDLAATLRSMLTSLAERLDVASGAIFLVTQPDGGLQIAASYGLSEDAAAGLSAAVRDPAHSVAGTVTDPVATFDVLPRAPGGPALRSHLPLIVRRHGQDVVVGVMALAYDPPMDADSRAVIEAVADLAAVAVELHAPK
jgi:GAF domain-containing protein